ncbi:hypothetical protein ACFP81_01780 [Deinococcus lacus]|uniref:Uncharacterized protein n=1 Tax=Deinococcus lacus TaxID=392561 RepID=A0ABW1Y9L5_9DEIO
MRVTLAFLALIIAGLYFTVGVRLGMVTLMPVQMFNAEGISNYKFSVPDSKGRVGVKGTCSVSSGKATLVLLDPKGHPLGGAECIRSAQPWAINLMGGGQTGNYTLQINYQKFSGKIDLKEQRGGGTM